MAKQVATAILSAVNEVDEKTDFGESGFFDTFSEQVKPWLNSNDSDVQERVANFMNKKSSEMTALAPGPAEDLHNAVAAMQKLIGVKGSLLHSKMWGSSVEKLKESCLSLALGDSFLSLDSTFTTWQKSSDPNITLTDESKGIVEEAELLLQAGKVVLACQSGCLFAAAECFEFGVPSLLGSRV